MKAFSVCLLISGVVFITEGLPRDARTKRETTSDASQALSHAQNEGSTSTISTEPTPPQQNNQFGIGAAAGIGGLTRSVGIGNFHTDPKSDAFAPWGAFAGLNLGNGGRIGAGCSGLSCGVQLGQLVLATPQLLGIGRNFLNQDANRNNGPEGKKLLEETSETNFNNAAAAANNNFNNQNQEQIQLLFRDAFQGFRDTLASFFRAPITHFVKKNTAAKIDNSTESVVGVVKSAASEPKTYRIQLGPAKITTPIGNENSNGDQDNIIIDTRN